MLRLKLCNDRTAVKMDRLAQNFSVSCGELEDCLRLGTITYWYELGASYYDTPRMVFHSTDTGRRIVLDRDGNVISRPEEVPKQAVPQPEREPETPVHLPSDEALQKAVPALDPASDGARSEPRVA